MANPFCAAGQLYSNTLPSTRTRSAFFSSKRFFTVQAVPAYVGSSAFHESGFTKWLCRISMSDGTRSAVEGSAPPKSRFSPAASRWLLRIAYGPGPRAVSVGIRSAYDGSMRDPAGGRLLAGASVVIRIVPAPTFAGRVNGPSYTAPAARAIVSPGPAAASAALRLPLSDTAIVRPVIVGAVTSTFARNPCGGCTRASRGGTGCVPAAGRVSWLADVTAKTPSTTSASISCSRIAHLMLLSAAQAETAHAVGRA